VRWTEGRNLEAFIELLSTGKLDVSMLITHRYGIDDASQAYELITGKKDEPFLGVLLTYPERATPSGSNPRRIPNPTAAAVSLKPGEILSLGVLGAGNYATATFLPAIHRAGGIAPIGIASATGLSAQNAARRFGFGYATSSEDELLADPAINIIAVLTRHQHHARQTLAALRSGRRVYCEKPLAITPEQLSEIAAALEQEDLPLLMVGFNRRFAPLARKLKAFVDERHEPLVAHYRVNAGPLPPDHWLHDPAQGGGRVIGEGCHFVDFLTYLVGANPQTVTVHAPPDEGRYREDNAVMTFSYPDGSVGTLSYLANGDKAFAKERVEVFCGSRAAVLDDFRVLELAHGGKRQAQRSALRQDKGHQAAWQMFTDAITNGGTAPIPYDQLIGVSLASFGAMQSLETGEKITL
jgi:predicted dehydrogenase